jgi:protein-tyrosine phosphatase
VIDTHCHLLHALDDGPSTLGDSVVLARELVGAGVRGVVCTPHYSRRFRTDRGRAAERVRELEIQLAQAEVPLTLSLAAEVSPAFAVAEPILELSTRSIGGFLIVELEPTTPAAVLGTVVERLANRALRPVFAHPERCSSVREQPRLLAEARARGALVQVVAPSLAGHWGSAVTGSAWSLLDSGLVDLLASDSHRPGRGARTLELAAEAVALRYGADTLANLTERGPVGIVGALAEDA